MMIQINEDYRITADRYNYSLEKRHTVKGEEVWRAQGYYSSLDSCISAYPDLILRTSDVVGIAEALEAVKTACKQLSSALSPKYEVTLK